VKLTCAIELYLKAEFEGGHWSPSVEKSVRIELINFQWTISLLQLQGWEGIHSFDGILSGANLLWNVPRVFLLFFFFPETFQDSFSLSEFLWLHCSLSGEAHICSRAPLKGRTWRWSVSPSLKCVRSELINFQPFPVKPTFAVELHLKAEFEGVQWVHLLSV